MLGREILCVVALLAATSSGIEIVEDRNLTESLISYDDLDLELQELQDAKPDSLLSDQNSDFSLSDEYSEPLSSEQSGDSSLSDQSSGPLSSDAHEGEDAGHSLSDLSRQDKLKMARVVAESVSPLVRILTFWWRGASESHVKRRFFIVAPQK